LNFLATAARGVLFGKTPNPALTAGNVTKHALLRLIGMGSDKAPTVGQYAKHVGVRTIERAFGIKTESPEGKLPTGWPRDVFAVIANEIEKKGGSVTLDGGERIPAFRLTTSGAAVLPHMFVAYIKRNSDYADYGKAGNLDASIEESLAQAGHLLTVRVMSKPLRVEIERTNPEAINLAGDWDLWTQQPQGRFEYIFGTYFAGKGLQIGVADLADPNECHAPLIGMTGSGKSQLALGIILTLAANTGPDALSMIIIDPKGVDFAPLDGLPHLANGRVLTRLADGVIAVRAIVAEMDRRAALKDGKVANKRIFLFIDELPNLLDLDRINRSKDDAGESLEDALIRLLQMGRGVGINVFVAAQQAKKEVVSTRVLENFPWRMVGSVNTFHASAHASGQDGCLAHKLPGKGSFLMYNPEFRSGVRVQSHFVADPKRDDYAQKLGAFVDFIRGRFADAMPHWRIGIESGPEQMPLPMVSTEQTERQPAGLSSVIEDAVRKVLMDMATIAPAADTVAPAAALVDLPAGMLEALEDAYNENPAKFNKSRVRGIWQEFNGGKRPKTDKEAEIFTAFLAYMESTQ
jgi:hypothetical protein